MNLKPSTMGSPGYLADMQFLHPWTADFKTINLTKLRNSQPTGDAAARGAAAAAAFVA